MQIHEHRLLKLSFSVVDGNRIVVPVEAMDEGLNGGFVNVTDIGGSLSGLVSHNKAAWCQDTDFFEKYELGLEEKS